MRYAIIADIHANLTAFMAVLVDIERRGDVEEMWCLGDIVGYGPDPHECIELLRQANHICV
ncbi:MAG: metallophosphoesterase, partial [Dehalococcoidales bacterium]|nr:metallophosphoesterase [Dehalococcoidales bacterium]